MMIVPMLALGALGMAFSTHIAALILTIYLLRLFGQAMMTQNALTATIFFSRLLPFVSFDMISYAAGLSVIKTWRFALATLIGVVPTAFLMAHLGEMAIDGDTDLAMWFSALLGIAVAIPFLLIAYRKIRPAIA